MELLLRLSAISQSLSITATQGFLIIFTIKLVYDALKKKIDLKNCEYIKFYFLLVLSGFLSVLFGINPKRSFISFRDEWLLFYFFVGFFYVPKISYRDFFNSIFFGGVIASFYAFYQFFFRHLERVNGFYSHSLTFGNVISILSVFCFSILLTKSYQNKKEKNFHMFSFIVFLFSLYLSGARGSLIFSIITLGITIYFYYGRKGAYIGLITIILLGIILYFLYTNPMFNRRLHELTNESFTNPQSSIGTRIALWKASFEIIKDYPVFGIGYGNFRSIIKNYLDVPVLTTAHAHNAYIQYMVLHGIFGFLCLVIFYYKIIKKLIIDLKINNFAIIGLAIFIVYLLQGLTENNFYDSEVAMIFWFLIGSILGIIEHQKKNRI